MTQISHHRSANPDEPPTYEEATSHIDLLVIAAPAQPPSAPPIEATPVPTQGVVSNLTSAARTVRTELGLATAEVLQGVGSAAVDLKSELQMARGDVKRELADAYTEVQKGVAEVQRSLFGFGGPCPSRSKCNRRSKCNCSWTGCKRRKDKC
ncbi:hypothetical protein CspeluHIS016_0209450 [Cutaneotrichosporon spelunceum]|uniref:Uncharacterized protein n=1 Tax=Cutaneotrichosporon spelunceum TaxID=1672016 RepID=A0AAD3TSA4_9TREE|nr:hypothetical protein CspeluHIS016_0209450 [Cutaneotrichosporon spelunceum]